MLKFLKELPDKYLSILVLLVLLGFYAAFQTTFFEQAVLFGLGLVGGVLRGGANAPAQTSANIETASIDVHPQPAEIQTNVELTK